MSMTNFNLEPDSEVRAELLFRIENFVSEFLKDVNEHTFYEKNEDQLKTLNHSFDSPQLLDNILSDIRMISKDSLNAASGGHFAYIPAGGIYYAAVADYVANVINKYTGLESTAKKAILVENHLIQFIGEKLVGYSDNNFGGNLTTGGSLANLTAIVAARDSCLKRKDFEKAVVFVTEHTHHCVAKALRIIGLSDKPIFEGGNIFKVDTDDQHKMNPKSLEHAIEKCEKSDYIPWLIIATAGTTNLGTVDNFDEIGFIAEKKKLWFHVDAAYGGFFLLLPELKNDLFKGIDKADSIVLDCHKSLFFPYGLGVVMVKNKDLLFDALYQEAVYINESDEKLKYSPANLSLELTRPFRGLKLWFTLNLLGKKPFEDALSEKMDLTLYAYNKISQIENVVCLSKPELTTFAFRYIPLGNINVEEVNKSNEVLMEMIKEDGKVYLSSTKIKINGVEKTFIRFTVLSFRSKQEHIDLAIATLKEKIKLVI